MMVVTLDDIRLDKTVTSPPKVRADENGADIRFTVTGDISDDEVLMLLGKCTFARPSGGFTMERSEHGTTVIIFYSDYKMVGDGHRDHSLDDDAIARLNKAAEMLLERLGC